MKPIITFLGDPDEEWEPLQPTEPIFVNKSCSCVFCKNS